MVALGERIEAIRSGVDAFNPDARLCARSLFEAQERLWKLLPEITALFSEREIWREALKAADKRLCELTPNFPPDGPSTFEAAEEYGETCGVVMQIRAALDTGVTG